MITNKETLLAMKPDDTLLVPTTDFTDRREIDFSGDVHFLTIELADRKGHCAVLLSGDEEAKMFKASNIYTGKLYFKRVKLKSLMPVLMVRRLSLLVDPFEDPLVMMTAAEMCDYCLEHKDEIFTNNLNNIWYLNLRISQANRHGGGEKVQLLKEIMSNGSFWVVSQTVRPISPLVTTVSKVDCRPHILLFTSLNLAQQFIGHLHGTNPKLTLIPMQMSAADIKKMMMGNSQARIEQFYLNDGAEAMAFSYGDFLAACRK